MPGFFESNGYSAEQRRILFLGACIPLRLYITYLIYIHSDKKNVLAAVSAITFIRAYIHMYNHMRNGANDVWWNRKVHSYIMFVASVCAFLLYIDKINDARILLYILLADVLYGLFTYFRSQQGTL